MNTAIQSARTYNFDVMKKTLPIKDVSSIERFAIPEEELPEVLDQGNVQCCIACVISEILSVMKSDKYSISYIYGKHRNSDSQNPGMLVESALKSMLNYGSIPYEIFPQLVEMPEVKKIIEEHPQWDKFAEQSRIKGYCNIRWNGDSEKFKNIKLALINYRIPLLAISKSGFGGSHSILIYGFEIKNGEPYIMIQNSWGKGYGINGRTSVPLSKIDYVYVLFDESIQIPFKDVSENDWFYGAVRNMFLQGYINGRSETEFCPNDTMTRAEVCAVLDRILKRQDEIHQAEFEMLESRLEKIEKNEL